MANEQKLSVFTLRACSSHGHGRWDCPGWSSAAGRVLLICSSSARSSLQTYSFWSLPCLIPHMQQNHRLHPNPSLPFSKNTTSTSTANIHLKRARSGDTRRCVPEEQLSVVDGRRGRLGRSLGYCHKATGRGLASAWECHPWLCILGRGEGCHVCHSSLFLLFYFCFDSVLKCFGYVGWILFCLWGESIFRWC